MTTGKLGLVLCLVIVSVDLRGCCIKTSSDGSVSDAINNLNDVVTNDVRHGLDKVRKALK